MVAHAYIGVHHTSNKNAAQIVDSGAINAGSSVQPFSADAAGIAAMELWLLADAPTGAQGNDTTFIVDITIIPLGPIDPNGGRRLDQPVSLVPNLAARIIDKGNHLILPQPL